MIMTKFDRHLLLSLSLSILAALLFLLGIDFLVQSSEESSNLGRENYSFLIMAFTLLLQIPSKTVEFLPAAVLVGSLMTLGQLNRQNELTVLRASGISKWRIARSGFILAISLGILSLLINEYLAQPLEQQSEYIKNQALGRIQQNQGQSIWMNENGERFIHIQDLNPDGTLGNINFYQKTNNTITIEHAEYASFAENHWQLHHVEKYTITPEKIEQIPSSTIWQTELTPELFASRKNAQEHLSLKELHNNIQFLKANRISHQNESLRFWQQLFIPLSTLTMLLLALPFAYSAQREQAAGTRLVIGILLGLLYYILEGILSNLSLLLNWPPVFGALAPIIILAIPPFILLLKT